MYFSLIEKKSLTSIITVLERTENIEALLESGPSYSAHQESALNGEGAVALVLRAVCQVALHDKYRAHTNGYHMRFPYP